MDNPYGLANLWTQGDWITKSVAIVLMIMSILSWFVMVVKTVNLIKLRRMTYSAENTFWHTKSFDEGVSILSPNRQTNPFRALAEDGADAAAHHAQSKDDLHGALNVSDWLTSCLRRSIDDATSNLHGGLAVLASIGSTAPFVGLFGTVWGIYHALISISISGQASIDKVAGPVGESLIMTAFGLIVAIPAVLGYNALTRGNKAFLAKLNRFAHDLHAYLVTGARIGRQTPTLKLHTTGVL